MPNGIDSDSTNNGTATGIRIADNSGIIVNAPDTVQGLNIQRTPSGGDPANPETSFLVDTNGKVAIGTDTPSSLTADVITIVSEVPGIRLTATGDRLGSDWTLAASSNGGANDFFGIINRNADDGATAEYKVRLFKNGDFEVGGAVVHSSDRNKKENYADVDPIEILKEVSNLNIKEWSYKSDVQKLRHIGPVAQDFHEAFGLGRDDKTIATVDADGVALTAIQGLHSIVKEKDAEIQSLREKTESLEAKLEMLLEKLDAQGE